MFRRLSPQRAYVTEDVYDDPRAVLRVERMMTCVDAELVRVSYEELDAIAAERWQADRRWGEVANPCDPDMVFTMAKFDDEDAKQRRAERYPHLKIRDLLGNWVETMRDLGSLSARSERKGIVCQSARELQTVLGCPFRCAYCGLGMVNRIFVNIEEYIEHLDELVAREPAQRLYKWDNRADVSCYEPEYGASELLIDYFAQKPGKFLEIYVGKSDNVEGLLSLDHRGKTILQWSLAPRTQCIEIEPESAPWDLRIEAARKCQEAGYTVRFRLSPIIPVRNWREEYAELIARVFERTRPDVIALCAFGWMDVEQMRACIDFELLDPQFVAAMEAAAPFLEFRGFRPGAGCPMPHDSRAMLHKCLIDEIRKHDGSIPIALCLETVEMWALFERELGVSFHPSKPTTFFCTCGPHCTPDHPSCTGVNPGASWFGDVS
jgi:Spore photoproduct lyase